MISFQEFRFQKLRQSILESTFNTPTTEFDKGQKQAIQSSQYFSDMRLSHNQMSIEDNLPISSNIIGKVM